MKEACFSIEDPIIKYFKDFEHDVVVSGVTIKHLLSHTSGLPDLRNVRSDPDFYLNRIRIKEILIQ